MKIQFKKKLVALITVIVIICVFITSCTIARNGNESSFEAESKFSVSETESAENIISKDEKSEEISLDEKSLDENSYYEEPETNSALIPISEKVDFKYFDDAVFIGDSVTLKLKYYITKKRTSDPNFMGKSQFLVAGSLGSGNALWKISSQSVHPTYNGEKMLLEDSIKACNAKKIYIMLGINDVAVYGTDNSVKNMLTLINHIKEKSPDAEIILQSATPIAKGAEGKKLTNKTLNEYNKKLLELCEEQNFYFLDIASELKDKEGFLSNEYASDKFVHLTDIACDIWINHLITHPIKN